MTARAMTLVLTFASALALVPLTGCRNMASGTKAREHILILTQPRDQMVQRGSTAVFSVRASSEGLNSQWLFNGELQKGLGGPTITIEHVAPSQVGLYTCRITRGKITTQTQPAALFMYTLNDIGALATVQGPLRPTPGTISYRCGGQAVKIKGYCSVTNDSGTWFPPPSGATRCVADTFDTGNNRFDTVVTATAKYPPMPNPSCNDNASPPPPIG